MQSAWVRQAAFNMALRLPMTMQGMRHRTSRADTNFLYVVAAVWQNRIDPVGVARGGRSGEVKNIGRYQVVRELHTTPYGGVFLARRSDAGQRQFALKLIRPDPLFVSREQAAARIDAFVAAAQLQRVVASKSDRWATIHDVEKITGHASHASHYYPLTGERLVSGRLTLSEESLEAMTVATARALADLRRHAGGRA